MNHRLFKVVVPIASVLLSFAALELGVRALNGDFVLRNNLWRETSLYKAAYPVAYDAMLGWLPRPGASAGGNIWRTQVTILPDGVRSNGRARPTAAEGPRGPILAVGDSFTFGDQVADADTWPAQLEARARIPTVNGGVFGYGIDQTYLRALQLMERYRPSAVVFGFIPDDIARTELAERGAAPKPYFELEGGALALRNTPIPERRESEWGARLRKIKEAVSNSELVHMLMSRLAPEFWFLNSWHDVRAHEDGVRVSCALINDLGRRAAEAHIAFYALAQYQYDSLDKPDDLALVADVLACLDRGSVRLIDLYHELIAIRAGDPERYDAMFDQHMTVAGNRFVAGRVHEAMTQRHIATTVPSVSTGPRAAR